MKKITTVILCLVISISLFSQKVNILLPQPGTGSIDLTPTFTWSTSGTGTLTNILYVDTDPDPFSGGNSYNAGTAQSYTLTTDLTAGTIYYWGVAVTDDNGTLNSVVQSYSPLTSGRGGTFQEGVAISTTAINAQSVFAADVNSDGHMDILSASQDDSEIRWYENNGSEDFSPHVVTELANGASSVYATDVDGDGDMDILSASYIGNKIKWYENDGSEAFTEHTISSSAIGAESVYASDMDGDGDMDVLSASYLGNEVSWYENDGSEGFTEYVVSTDNTDGVTSVYAVDMDKDGDMDVVYSGSSTSSDSKRVYWCENDGSQNFTAIYIKYQTGASSAFATDVNSDGNMDVVFSSRISASNGIYWCENDGSQSFATITVPSLVNLPFSVYAADVNSDGNMDILSASKADDKVSCFINNGSEVFTQNAITTSADGARSVYAADVDGDGDLDILSASEDDHKIAWYENTDVATWTGAAGSNWSDGSNWSGSEVPTSNFNITIPDVSKGTAPVIGPTGTADCNNLTISGGSLTIQSTVAGTGSLIIERTAIGSIKMERYVAAATWGAWDDGWHHISSPVANYDIEISNFTPETNYDFYAWSEPDNEWINFIDGTDPTFEFVNGSDDFELGHGYLAAYEIAGTKNFTGTINVNDVPVSNLDITGSGSNRSWHLLGNPFTSALTWYTDWTTSSISGTAKIWNEENKSYTTLSGGDPIPATNGFMVQATADDASLTIPASKRVHNSQEFYKNSRYGYPIIKLKANNMDNPSAQESEIRFNPESTNEWDMVFDSDFLSGYAPFFYSLIDARPMAVNSMPDYSENTIIPFTFIKNEGLNFSIGMYEIENMDLDVYLFDKKTNNEHNLSQNPVYTFTSFTGDNIERFEIRFKTVGIEEPTANSNIQIWSANKTINILNPDHKKGRIRIINMYGQILIETQLNGDKKQEISVNLTAGNYIVNVINDRRVISKKVFVK